MIRYAIVRNARSIKELRAYLPDNYQVIWQLDGETDTPTFVIEGKDDHGWTLDGYVIPRLGSGLIWADEIGLDHPVMKDIPIEPPRRRVAGHLKDGRWVEPYDRVSA